MCAIGMRWPGRSPGSPGVGLCRHCDSPEGTVRWALFSHPQPPFVPIRAQLHGAKGKKVLQNYFSTGREGCRLTHSNGDHFHAAASSLLI